MNIISARINWNHNFANNPDLEILVEKAPNYKAFRYQENSGRYFAELDGFCHFFYYVQPGEGFGGRDKLPDFHIDGMEVVDAKWARVDDLSKYDFAFSHDKLIMRYVALPENSAIRL